MDIGSMGQQDSYLIFRLAYFFDALSQTQVQSHGIRKCGAREHWLLITSVMFSLISGISGSCRTPINPSVTKRRQNGSCMVHRTCQ